MSKQAAVLLIIIPVFCQCLLNYICWKTASGQSDRAMKQFHIFSIILSLIQAGADLGGGGAMSLKIHELLMHNKCGNRKTREEKRANSKEY